jgi:hypothetical protein
MKAVAASPANRNLSPPLAATSDRLHTIDVIAEAYNDALNDPAIRTMHDAARYILAKLEAAGAGFGFASVPDEITHELHLSSEWIEAFCNLPRGTLQGTQPSSFDPTLK